MSILICTNLLKWAVENVPAIKAPDEQSVCGLTLLSVPAGSLPSPIKAGKSVVTADVLPGLSNTFKLICWFVSSLLGTTVRAHYALCVPRGALFDFVLQRVYRGRLWSGGKRAEPERCWVCVSVCERKIFKMMHTTCRFTLLINYFTCSILKTVSLHNHSCVKLNF